MKKLILLITAVVLVHSKSLEAQTCGHTGIYQHRATAGGNLTRLDQRNDGSIGFDVAAGNFGLEYPYGSGYSILFAGGFFLGGLKEGVGPAPDTVNVAQVEYEAEWLPGRIVNTGPFGTLTAEDHDTAHTFFVLPDDYACWPAEAPHDQSGLPLQLSSLDTWTVYNDLSIELTDLPQFSPSPGFGLHMERQTFHFGSYPFSHGILVRLRLINKSNAAYPQFYIGIWNDPDVGSQAGEDLSGFDSVLSLGYTYSSPTGGDIFDGSYGCVVLQGPVVESSGDTARVLDVGPSGFTFRSMPGKAVLLASSGTAHPNGPSGNCGQNTGDICRYNYLQGLQANGTPKPGGVWDPWGGRTPNDQRIIISSGPFTFAAGDTQDVWYVMMGAQAATSLISVDSLKARVPIIRDVLGFDPIVTSIPSQYDPPSHIILFQNSPNPFNPTTTIRYELSAASPVTLKIFNALGQEVRTLVSGSQFPGPHEVTWDGKNDLSQAVSSGIYLYQIRVGKTTRTMKMTLLK